MYTFLLAMIYLAFISLGLPDSLLGSGWPAMHTDLGIPVSYMGIVSMMISAGTVVSSLMSDKLTRKFGTRTVVVVSVFMTAAALIGFSFSQNFLMLLVFCLPYGLGAGAIDASLNNYVALHYSSRHMSWLHCFWGVGTIISPFVMSSALMNSTWNSGYRIIGIIQICIGVILLATFPLWNIHRNSEEESKKSVGLVSALRIKGVPLILIGFFAYCAMESTAMGWASTYLAEVKGAPAETAARFASLFCIGITAGRFLSGFITNRLGDRKMIVLGTVIAAAGIVAVIVPVPFAWLSLAGFVTIGLGCAPIYPCIIHSTPSNFGAENSGAVIGLQMASAYVGTTFMPPLFGVIADALGFPLLPFYLALFAVMMAVFVFSAFRITDRERHTLEQKEQHGVER